MIQRQQTLWLLLSAICAFLSFQLPFYSGTVKPEEITGNAATHIDAGDNLFLMLCTGLVLLVALVAIFLFKDRKLQFKVTIGGAVLSLIIILLYFSAMKRFASGSISLWSLFSFAMLIGFIMAARGIRKDEKLVKSLDKLR